MDEKDLKNLKLLTELFDNYGYFEIGSSDIGALLLGGLDEKSNLISKYLEFGSDGEYKALLVDKEAKIGEDFELMFTSHHWLSIFDDAERTKEIRGREIKVYQNPKTRITIIQTLD